MIFNIGASFKNLKNSKNKKYSLMIADTVLIGKDKNENLTKSLSSHYSDISYSLEDDESGEVSEEEYNKPISPAKNETTLGNSV